MKILVVDDHALIRQAMHGVVKRLARNSALLEASNGAQALDVVAANPDVELVLLDLSLPDRDGFSVFSELRTRYPSIAIVVLSAVQDSTSVRRALEGGARGYIPKSSSGEVMLSALRLINSGGIYVPPEIMEPTSDKQELARLGECGPYGPSLVKLGLTNRQFEVLGLMMEGKSNKTICRVLNLSEATVKNHVTAVLRALGATSRTEAVVRASGLGLQSPETGKR